MSIEERQREISEYLKGDIERMFAERTSQTMEYLRAHKAEILQSLTAAVKSASAAVQPLIECGRKQIVRYAQFSFLLSGAVNRELQLKIDFYDTRYYADITESGGYWDYSSLFPFIDEDMNELHGKLLKKFQRIKEYELLDIRLVYYVGVFAIMEMVLTELAAETAFTDAFRDAFTEVFEPEIYVLFGAYHDQSKLIAKVKRR